MTKRFGFTLAEVLITLGIIGVVAAMTIPNLIANTNGAKFRSQFKKTISTLNQAGLMAQAQYDFDYAGAVEACTAASGGTEDPTQKLSFCSLLNGTLTGQRYIGDWSKILNNGNAYSVKIPSIGLGTAAAAAAPAASDWLGYQLADGSIVGFKAGVSGCELELGQVVNNARLTGTGSLVNCIGFIDVNGATLPNKEVTCTTDTAASYTNTTLTPEEPCAVKNDATHMTDIFPIVFHDATVEPATNAAKYVLTTSK